MDGIGYHRMAAALRNTIMEEEKPTMGQCLFCSSISKGRIPFKYLTVGTGGLTKAEETLLYALLEEIPGNIWGAIFRNRCWTRWTTKMLLRHSCMGQPWSTEMHKALQNSSCKSWQDLWHWAPSGNPQLKRNRSRLSSEK